MPKWANPIFVGLLRLSFLFGALGLESDLRIIDPPGRSVAGQAAAAARAPSADCNLSSQDVRDPLSLKRARPEPTSLLHLETTPSSHPDLAVNVIDGPPHRVLAPGGGAEEPLLIDDDSQADEIDDPHGSKKPRRNDQTQGLPVSRLGPTAESTALSSAGKDHSTEAYEVDSDIEHCLPRARVEGLRDDSSVQKGMQAIKCPADSTTGENPPISNAQEGQSYDLARVTQSAGALGVKTHSNSMVEKPTQARCENQIPTKSTSKATPSHDALSVAERATNKSVVLGAKRRPSGNSPSEILCLEECPPLKQKNPQGSGETVKAEGKREVNMNDVHNETRPQVYFKPPRVGGSLVIKLQFSSKTPPGIKFVKGNTSLEQTKLQGISETNKVRGEISDVRKAPGEAPIATKSQVCSKSPGDRGPLVTKNTHSGSIPPEIKATQKNPAVRKRKSQESGETLNALETPSGVLPCEAKPQVSRKSRGDGGSLVTKHQPSGSVPPVTKSAKENLGVGKAQPKERGKIIEATGKKAVKMEAPANVPVEMKPQVYSKPSEVADLEIIPKPPESAKPEVSLSFSSDDLKIYSWIGSLTTTEASPDEVHYIELFMIQLQKAQESYLGCYGGKPSHVEDKIEISNFKSLSASKKSEVNKSLQQRHQHVRERILFLVRVIWQLNRFFFDSLGVPEDHPEYIIEQLYLLDWLLKRLLEPETGLPLITLAKNDLKKCASQLGNLELYLLRHIDYRMLTRSWAVPVTVGKPEMKNVSHTIMTTTRTACRLMGHYYKETNLRKWNLFFPSDTNFLGNLARIKDKIDRDKYQKFKLLRRVGFNSIVVLPWEKKLSKDQIKMTNHAIMQLKFHEICASWSKGNW